MEKLKPILPKTLKAKDVILQNTLGDIRIKGIIPKGTQVRSVRIIAGYGTSTNLRYKTKLVAKYGGDEEKWEKKGGIVQTANFAYDIHWDEYNKNQYDTKLKAVKRR